MATEKQKKLNDDLLDEVTEKSPRLVAELLALERLAEPFFGVTLDDATDEEFDVFMDDIRPF